MLGVWGKSKAVLKLSSMKSVKNEIHSICLNPFKIYDKQCKVGYYSFVDLQKSKQRRIF